MDKLGDQSPLSRLTQFSRPGVLKVEGALALLDLVLIVDHFEDAGAELGSDLAQDTIGLQRLDHQVL